MPLSVIPGDMVHPVGPSRVSSLPACHASSEDSIELGLAHVNHCPALGETRLGVGGAPLVCVFLFLICSYRKLKRIRSFHP